MDKLTLKWIKSTLCNDEYSSDEEMVEYFMQEGKLSEEEARAWVAKRDFYMNNLVIEDNDINDIGVFDPNSRTIKPLSKITH